eukprot:TRINITY_DN4757_c0_g2_i1.p1 TRINITY_DN4757_c0_g2~~TRINITY_DN4757_c0_g2_i1.p1  ORF type:complete len:1526 (+),score=365.70 TRINITY_DN4757_c0_g2_i1:199-4578(+)
MLKLLFKLLNNSDLKLKNKALEAIQFFDAKFHENILSGGFLKNLLGILSIDIIGENVLLLLKALSFLEHIDVSQQKSLIKEGVLDILVKFLTCNNDRIVIKSLSVLSNFDSKFYPYIIESKYFENLHGLLKSTNNSIVIKAIESVAAINPGLSILYEAKLIQTILQFSSANKPPLSEKANEIIESILKEEKIEDAKTVSALLSIFTDAIPSVKTRIFKSLSLAGDESLMEADIFSTCSKIILAGSPAYSQEVIDISYDLTKKLCRHKKMNKDSVFTLIAGLTKKLSWPTVESVNSQNIIFSLLEKEKDHVLNLFYNFHIFDYCKQMKSDMNSLEFVTYCLDVLIQLYKNSNEIKPSELLKLIFMFTEITRDDYWLQGFKYFSEVLDLLPAEEIDNYITDQFYAKIVRAIKEETPLLPYALKISRWISDRPSFLKLINSVCDVPLTGSDYYSIKPPLLEFEWSGPSTNSYTNDGTTVTVTPAETGTITLKANKEIPQHGTYRWSVRIDLGNSTSATASVGVVSGDYVLNGHLSIGISAKLHSCGLFSNGTFYSNGLSGFGKGAFTTQPIKSGDTVHVIFNGTYNFISYAINSIYYGAVPFKLNSTAIFTPAISLKGAAAYAQIVKPMTFPSPDISPWSYEVVRSWLPRKYYNMKWDLLYKASIDGWIKKIFDERVSDTSPTIVMVKLGNGNIWGGAKLTSWKVDNLSVPLKDTEFLFQLNSKTSSTGPLFPTGYKDKPVKDLISFGKPDICINLESPGASTIQSLAYNDVGGIKLDVYLGGVTLSNWKWVDVEVWGSVHGEMRALEVLMDLLEVSEKKEVKDHIQFLFNKISEMGQGNILKEAKLHLEKSAPAKPLTLPPLKLLKEYKIVSVNGFPVKKISQNSESNELYKKLSKHLNLDKLHLMENTDTSYWFPNRDHLIHIVLEYEAEGPLPHVTHFTLQSGFDDHPCHRAILFTSNELKIPINLLGPISQFSQKNVSTTINPITYKDPKTKETEDLKKLLEDKIRPGVYPVVSSSDTGSWSASEDEDPGNEQKQKDTATVDPQPQAQPVTDIDPGNTQNTIHTEKKEEPLTTLKITNDLPTEVSPDEFVEAYGGGVLHEDWMSSFEDDENEHSVPGLDSILELGFESDIAILALRKTKGNVEQAVALIMDDLDSLTLSPPVPPPLKGRRKTKRTKPSPDQRPLDEKDQTRISVVGVAELSDALSTHIPLAKTIQSKYFHIVLVGSGEYSTRLPPSVSFLSLIGYEHHEPEPLSIESLPDLISMRPPPEPVVIKPTAFNNVQSSLELYPVVKSCRYTGDPSSCGVFFTLGSLKSVKSSWDNPAKDSTVTVLPATSFSLMSYGSPEDLKTETVFKMQDNKNTVKFIFGSHLISISHVLMRLSSEGKKMVGWKIEGGELGKSTPTLLFSQSNVEASKSPPHLYLVKEINNCNFFDQFTVTFTADITLSAIEFYGVIKQKL